MIGLDLAQLKSDIALPVALALGLGGDPIARAQMAVCIAVCESNARELRQIGGPALGICQMEPATHDDCWTNFLKFRTALGGVCLGYLPARFGGQAVGNAIALEESLAYSIAMASIRFYRSPVALPKAADAYGMNAAWRLGYNTTLGKGAIDAAHTALCQMAISA